MAKTHDICSNYFIATHCWGLHTYYTVPGLWTLCTLWTTRIHCPRILSDDLLHKRDRSRSRHAEGSKQIIVLQLIFGELGLIWRQITDAIVVCLTSLASLSGSPFAWALLYGTSGGPEGWGVRHDFQTVWSALMISSANTKMIMGESGPFLSLSIHCYFQILRLIRRRVN